MTEHIITENDLYRITLEDGEWVDILAKMPVTVWRDVAKASLNELLNGAFRIVELNRVSLYKMIKAWSFKDKEGRLIPVEPAYIDRLDRETAELVMSNIRKLNPLPGVREG